MKTLLVEMSGPLSFVVSMAILVVKEKFLKKPKRYTRLWIPKGTEYKNNRNVGGW